MQAPGGELAKGINDAFGGHVQFNESVYRFYPLCTEASTVCCKVDDDVVYVHPKFFQNPWRTAAGALSPALHR